jgi:hypothetical protein
MKTIYKQLSFLSIGFALNISNVWSHNLTREDQNSHLFFSDYKANTLLCTDYSRPESADNFNCNTVAQLNRPSNMEGVSERFSKSSDRLLNNNEWTFGNNVFGFKAYSVDLAKGGHRGCSVYKYEYKNGVLLPASKTRYNLYTYDDNGNPVEHIYYDPTSSRSDKETFNYNANGKLTQQVTFFKNGSVCEKTIYKYNAAGNLYEVIWYESGYRLMNRETYRYDKQNNIVEEGHYAGMDTLVGKDTYQYNDKGKMTEHKSIDDQGSVSNLITYRYDVKNHLIEKKTYSSEPAVIHTYVYIYNEQGNLTQVLDLQENKCSVKKDVYSYDAKGNMITHNAFDNNYLVKDTFDPKGNKLETVNTYKGYLNGKSVYTYDVDGNMIDEVLYNTLNEAYGRMQYVFF